MADQWSNINYNFSQIFVTAEITQGIKYIIYVNISPGSYSILLTVQTDINQDGVWDILDISILTGFSIEDFYPNEIEFMNSDINQDGILDILDLIIIINIILEN